MRHTIIFKTIEAGKRVGGNLFPKLLKYLVRKELPNLKNPLRMLSLEAALLDALLVHK